MALCSGVVKSFGLTKGYGFIESAQVTGDVIFGRGQLPPELKEPFYGGFFELKGRQVTFTVQFKDGKQQASNITVVPTEGEPLVGLVKSYNASKGFGFLTSSSLEGRDVFFSWRDVPPQLQGLDLKGCPVRFMMGSSPDGKSQAKDVVFNDMAPLGNLGLAPMGWNPQMASMGMMGKGLATMPMMGMGKGMPGKGMMAQLPMAAFGMMGKGMMGKGGKGMPSDGQGLQGRVKTFNSQKGFGFITCSSCPADVYFKSEGRMFSEGVEVAFYLKVMPDGKLQARGVTGALLDGQSCIGTVKSYNAKNGFGFISMQDQPADVHFKKDVVPPAIQEAALEGKTVQFIVQIHNGKPFVQNAQFLM